MVRRFLAILLAAICLMPAAALAFQDCRTFDYSDATTDLDFDCEVVSQTTQPGFGRTVAMRTLINADDAMARSSEPVVFTAAKDVLAKLAAMDAGMPLKLNDISLVVARASTKVLNQEESIAFARPVKAECVIVVLPDQLMNATSNDLGGYLRTVLAHEMFHCIQFETWPGVRGKKSDWWVEGGANFVAQMMAPHMSDMFRLNLAFSDQFRGMALTDLSYSAVVFFAWAHARDPHLPFRIMANAAQVPGNEAAQQAALIAQVPPEQLSQFVRDYLDGLIWSPDGMVPLRMETNIGEITFTDTEIRDLKTMGPYRMFAIDAQLVGGNYDVDFIWSGDLLWKRKLMTAGADWGEGPLTTTGDCTSGQVVRLAGMAFDAAGLTFSATRRDDSPDCQSRGVSETARDQCLIGTWMIDNVSLADSISDAIDAKRKPDLLIEGKSAIVFRPDGTMDMGFTKFAIAVKENQPGAVLVGARINGVISSLWDGRNAQLNICFVSAKAALQFVVPGGVSDAIDFNSIPRTERDSYRYNCDEPGHLWLEANREGTPYVIRLKRVAP